VRRNRSFPLNTIVRSARKRNPPLNAPTANRKRPSLAAVAPTSSSDRRTLSASVSATISTSRPSAASSNSSRTRPTSPLKCSTVSNGRRYGRSDALSAIAATWTIAKAPIDFPTSSSAKSGSSARSRSRKAAPSRHV